MAMDLSGFNAAEIEPNTAYEPIPAGWYQVVITDSEQKPTKAMTGSYLQMTMEVIDGLHKGRKVFERLNLDNPNQTAVEIAQRTLSAICRATGVMTPRQSGELHDKPMMAKIAVKPAANGYDASNEVKGYEPANGAPANPQQPTAQASASDATPPWKR